MFGSYFHFHGIPQGYSLFKKYVWIFSWEDRLFPFHFFHSFPLPFPNWSLITIPMHGNWESTGRPWFGLRGSGTCSVSSRLTWDADDLKQKTLTLIFRSSVESQCHSVQTSLDSKIIVFFSESWVAESNGDVRILIESCEITVCAQCSTNLAKSSPERLARRRAASSCNAFAVVTFLVRNYSVLFLQNNNASVSRNKEK